MSIPFTVSHDHRFLAAEIQIQAATIAQRAQRSYSSTQMKSADLNDESVPF
jgi:hypothetical protein